MKQKTRKQSRPKIHGPQTRSLGPVYSAIIIFLVAVCVVAAVLDYLKRHPSPKPDGTTAEMTEKGPTSGQEPGKTPGKPVEGPALTNTSAGPEPIATNKPAPTVPTPPPAPALETVKLAPSLKSPVATALDTRQIVRAMIRFDQTDVPFTAEQAATWKANVQKLVQQGKVAIPAIREFLAKRLDHHFGPEDIQQVGYTSIRVAMFDALQQIGGLGAIATSFQTMQTTADPLEVALLARNLENMAPGQYRPQALKAAKETLDMAALGRLPNRDVAPLFELLQTYGGTGVVPELEKAVQHWKYYATAALAWLPEDAGIPSLVHMAQESGGGQDAALQMLVQVATQNEDAHDTVLQLAGSKRIPANLWPYLTSPLSGDEIVFQSSVSGRMDPAAAGADLNATHINYGNQNFYRGPSETSLTSENLNRKVAFIDELLKVTSDQVALQTLQNARERTLKRLAKVSGSDTK